MGNTQSSSSDPRFVSATRAFSLKELEDLKSLFKSLASQSQSNGLYVSLSVFKSIVYRRVSFVKAYIGIDGSLGDRMFDLVNRNRKDGKITFEDIVIAKGTYEKGTYDEIDEFIYQLLDINSDGFVDRSDLEGVLTVTLDKLFSQKHSEHDQGLHQETVGIFLNAAIFSKDIGGSDRKSMSFEDFRKWCAHLPSVRKFLGSLLTPYDSGSHVPRLVYQRNIDSNMMLLKEAYAWHVGGALSHQELDEWELVYHSSFNGLSFNTFLGNVSNDEGPTVLVVKDSEGCIYGGYAPQPWKRHADFYGDLKSFLFQLYPKASVYRPSGANHNLQWCAANFSSESIPNGIGFGGRVNHFGLFVSANFDQGHSFPCTTFGSPSLSKANKIYPEVIECWRVVSKKAQQETHEGVKGSVLERFKEDRHLLNMVGLANASE